MSKEKTSAGLKWWQIAAAVVIITLASPFIVFHVLNNVGKWFGDVTGALMRNRG